MRDSDWLKLNMRLIFLICVQTQILCNGAYMTQFGEGLARIYINTIFLSSWVTISVRNVFNL